MPRDDRSKDHDPHLHELGPAEEANALTMDARNVSAADRAAGHARYRRPPYPGERVGRSGIAHQVVGIDSISPLLSHVSFPATRKQILDTIGDARVALTRHRSASVRDVLTHEAMTGANRFESRDSLERALRQSWEQIAGHEGRGTRKA